MIINDPIYNKFSIKDKVLIDIVQHPLFTRLLNINVIPFPNPYFPAAIENSEYYHALGVMHLVDVVENIHPIISDLSLTLKIACLLHYIIDRPIEEPSQRVERILNVDLQKSRLHTAIYRTSFYDIVTKNGIEEEVKQAIEINLEGFKENKGIDILFNSIVGIKKLDYLPRDAHFTSTKYVRDLIDIKRILKEMFIDKKIGVAISDPVSPCIEKFFAAYNIMFRDVYLHREKNIIDAMYETAYHYLIKKNKSFLVNQIESRVGDLPLFFTLHDNNILQFLLKLSRTIKDNNLTILLEKIRNRIFYRKILSVKISASQARSLLKNHNLLDKIKTEIFEILKTDNELSVILSIPMGEVIIESMKKTNNLLTYKNIPIMESDIPEIVALNEVWRNMQYANVLVDDDVVNVTNGKTNQIRSLLENIN